MTPLPITAYCSFQPTATPGIHQCAHEGCGNRTAPTPHAEQQIIAQCRASEEYQQRLVRGLACRHRGGQSGFHELAGGCGCPGQLVPLFGCDLHQACTVSHNGTRGRKAIACCLSCTDRDYQPAA